MCTHCKGHQLCKVLSCIEYITLSLYIMNSNVITVVVGHPLAASGSRITGHLVHEMQRRGAKRSIGSACMGGGQGIALLLENC